MKQYQRMLTRAGAALLGVASPLVVFAAGNPFKQAQSDLSAIQTNSGVGSTDLPTLVGRIINAVLGVLGLLLLVYLLYGGFLWMTSGGDSEGVKKAKTMITNAVIGLVIITLSVVITSYVVSRLGSAIK